MCLSLLVIGKYFALRLIAFLLSFLFCIAGRNIVEEEEDLFLFLFLLFSWAWMGIRG